jgi:uncharacterized protein with PIN domain
VTACLDAWAVVAWLENDPAAAQLEAHIAGARCCMSWVNAGEVHYVVHRRTDRHTADRVIAQLRADVDLIDATSARVLDAATIKSAHRMSYADCFAVATALEFGVPLITRDPEIVAAAISGLEVVDLGGR